MTTFSGEVQPLTPALADAWVALFETSASGCFCRYWHFDGSKNDWLARLAFAPEQNEHEARALLAAGDPTMAGFVAIEGRRVIGWLKLAPRRAVPKLRRLPVYRSLDLGPDDGIVSVACLLVEPAHRRRGVARALLHAGMAWAERHGSLAIEAYPHRRSEGLRDEEAWLGPLGLFEANAFEDVAGGPAYPVLRRSVKERVPAE